MSAVAVATCVRSRSMMRASVRSPGTMRQPASLAIVAFLHVLWLARTARPGFFCHLGRRELGGVERPGSIGVGLAEPLLGLGGIFIEGQPAVAIDVQLGEVATARGEEFILADRAILVMIAAGEALLLAGLLARGGRFGRRFLAGLP